MSRARTVLRATIVATLLSLPLQSEAQVPPEIEQRLRAIGRVIEVPNTFAIYATHHEQEPYAGVRVFRDLRYGTHDRHLLDVFAPEIGGADRPVLVFIHGGGFVAGNKRTGTPPFYDNVALWAARNGMVGVNATYRLAPAAPWPAGAEDVGRAIGWVKTNIAPFGGDPSRIVAVGHSAGAYHVADVLAQAALREAVQPGVAGAILISGLFDPGRPPGANRAYFGEDASKYPERSVLPGLTQANVPILIVWAELDPPAFIEQSRALNDALCAGARCPRTLALPKHSHISGMLSINTEDVALSGAIAEFVSGLR